MADNFIICEVCGEQRGINTPGCAICTIHEMEKKGHTGYFDLLNGWTCYLACPECNPGVETDNAKVGCALQGKGHAYENGVCKVCGADVKFS